MSFDINDIPYTKEKWLAVSGEYGHVVYLDVDGVSVELGHDNLYSKESRADLYIILKAPELLQALDTLVDACCIYTDMDPTVEMAHEKAYALLKDIYEKTA